MNLKGEDVLGHLALLVALYEKRKLATNIRRRNRCIWADDGFSFVV